jgi:hypothetical protein
MDKKPSPITRKLRFVALGFACCLTVGGAQAAWKVDDDETQRKVDTTNDRLRDIYNSLKIDRSATAGDPKPEPEPTDATEKLDHSSMTTVSVTAGDRCPSATVGGLAIKQNRLCNDIVNTEKAKYMYSLRMYDLSVKRWDRLKEIQRERQNINDDELGKLEDNTNKLLSLIALMEIDRQQHQVYMAAYDARLSHLAAARDTLSKQALNGSSGGWVGTAIGGGVLIAALEAAKSHRDGSWESHRRDYGLQ